MKKPVIKYLCPICEKPYDTPEEAAACYKSPADRFNLGDIVWDGNIGFVYRITWLPDSGTDGASVEPVQELITAASLYPRSKKDLFLVGSFWCKAEKYPVEKALELVRQLEKRLEAARAFLKQVQIA